MASTSPSSRCWTRFCRWRTRKSRLKWQRPSARPASKPRQHAHGGSQEAEEQRQGDGQEPEGRLHRDACRRTRYSWPSASSPTRRTPGLDAAGVELDGGVRRQSTRTCAPTCRTSTPSATARASWRLAHVASAQGIVAAETLAGVDTIPFPAERYTFMPRCTYLQPAGRQPRHDGSPGEGGGLRDQDRQIPVHAQRQGAGARASASASSS